MATVDTYISLNMLNGFDFSNLLYAQEYHGDAGWFTASHADGTNDTLWGYGFTYDMYGAPTGEGTVTEYSLYGNYSSVLLLDVSGVSVPVSVVLDAAWTASTSDDIAIVRTALAGADTIYGSDYADVLDGFNGNDTIQAWGGNDTVYGEAGNDYLSGMVGNDYLNGGTGADTMIGGLGNDVFIVDHAGDRVLEAAGQGTDTIYTSVSFALAGGQQVETLSAISSSGTAAINLSGNELAQRIIATNGANIVNGGGGNDVISGLGGNDIIYGGAGNDTLAGGAGYDYFVFNIAINASTNVDKIQDFNVVQDTIRLENAVMPGLGSHLGTLYAANFWKSTTGLAHDSNDRIIYETDTGRLNYDSNGTAAGGAVHIATLAPNLALTHADFFVI
jgi:Ca2+-binding RTX toxin-like protein